MHSRKILVVNLAGLGDIVLCSPALKALQETFPQDNICLLTFGENRELIECCPYLTKVFYFEKKISFRNLKTIFRINRERFDMAVNVYNIHSLKGALKMFALFRLINTRECFGRDTNGYGFFYHQKIKETRPFRRHDAETMLRVVNLLGAKGNLQDLELWVREEKENFNRFLREHNIREGDCLIGLHPGASRASHRWPVDDFAELAGQLSRKYGAKIILTGLKEEEPLTRAIQSKSGGNTIVAAGELSMPDLIEFLKRYKFFITNDTAPMHIADALDVPMVVLSGESPAAFLPYKQKNTVALRNKPLSEISVNEVLNAVDSLSRGERGPREKGQDFSPVKVLHLHTRALIGGSGTNVLLTLQGLPKDQFCGHLAVGKKEAQQPFLDQVASGQITMHFIDHLQNKINVFADFLALFEIIRLIKKEEYAIVHTHNSKAGILGRLAARVCGVPVIIHTIHSCEFHYGGLAPITKQFFLILEKWAGRITDHFVAISKPLKEEFISRRIASDNKISVVYSGIEIEKFKTDAGRRTKRDAFGLKDDDCVVGTIARMDRGKGYEDMLKIIPSVVRQRSNVKFLFVGDGPLKNRLEDMARDANINDHVVFTGLRLDIPEILQAIDIFCLPSLYEGMGRVVLEAQASSRPVVATNVGGLVDVTKDNTTAFLVAPKDYYALSKAIVHLAVDGRLRKKMGRAAGDFVDARFSAETMVEGIIAIYRRKLSEKDEGL